MTSTQDQTTSSTPSSTDWLLSVPLVPEVDKQPGILVSPGSSGVVTSYSLVYDVYVPSASANKYIAFLQTDVGNGNDGDLFGKKNAAGTGFGISNTYEGSASYDAWHRIAFTVENGPNGMERWLGKSAQWG